MTLRRGTPTRESVLDLVFEVRPLFTGPIPDGMQKCGPLQDEVMAAADDLRELLAWGEGRKIARMRTELVEAQAASAERAAWCAVSVPFDQPQGQSVGIIAGAHCWAG